MESAAHYEHAYYWASLVTMGTRQAPGKRALSLLAIGSSARWRSIRIAEAFDRKATTTRFCAGMPAPAFPTSAGPAAERDHDPMLMD